ncbi:MAG TPA: response regulator transcription factor [Thermomicrobiales bacterium]|nr:response regulator transcription factor [Thermomicrobiales bacterium]
MRLTQRQQAARKAIERLGGSGGPPIQLAERICAALSSAIPNDGYRLFGVDPSTTLVNRLLAASDGDSWARREWLRDVYLTADTLPYVELPTLMRLRLPVVASHSQQSACWGYPTDILAQLSADAHERAFHELGSPVGGTILASFASRETWVAAMQLYRRDPDSPFMRSDVAFLRSMATTIGTVLAAALAREEALRSDHSVEEASGIVLLNQTGAITFATPAGESWLDHLRAVEYGSPDDLPTSIAAVVAGLRANRRPSQQIVAQLPGGAVSIEASSGGEDTVALVIRRRQPATAPEIPVNWPLTPQERQVARLLALGKSNRDISATLFVSENTVQTHLRHIYAKLEVSGRTQLLRRLFRESGDVCLVPSDIA